MKNRKKSIFEYILVPLLIVIIVQGFFSLVTFQYAGTTKILYENAVDLLKHTSENRKNQVENLMISRWSNVETQVQGIEDTLKKILRNKNITIDEFLKNEEYQRSFLVDVSPTVIDGIRNNNVTGAFIIMSDGKGNLEKREEEGVYFRDSDPDKNPDDYTDLSLIKGRAEIGKEYQIPLEPLWEGKFRFYDLSQEQAAYYYNPLLLAKENLDARYSDLGYWSQPFYLNENTGVDAYKQMTYSIPLIYQGRIYGVYGTEIEMGYFCEQLPVKEIDAAKCGSYVLVNYNQKNQLNVLMESGNLLAMTGLSQNQVNIVDTNFEKLQHIAGTDLYGVLSPLKIYDSNSPFAEKQVAIMTITSEEKLFGIGDDLLNRFMIVTVSSLLFGAICIYFVANRATRPIRIMAEYLRNSKSGELRHFQDTKAKEIDELYDVICNLNERQLETEAELNVEKERYIAALESSTNIIFEYGIQEDIFCQYTFMRSKDGEGKIEKKDYKHARQEIEQFGVMDKNDRKKLDEYLQGVWDSSVICICLKEEGGFQWLELGGKIIHDEYDIPQKIVGSIRDVTDELRKRKELEQIKDRDCVTGLWNLNAGKRELLDWENEGIHFQVLLIDIDHFSQINENQGIVFGNMVLEELGDSICKKIKNDDIAIRCGGDQIFVMLREKTLHEAKNFCNQLNWSLEELNMRAKMDVSISIGIVCYQVGGMEFQELINRACISVQYAKQKAVTYSSRNGKQGIEGKVVAYEEMLEIDKNKYNCESYDLREIMGIEYEKTMNLSTIAFNVFDKAHDVTSVIPFLLGKIAKAFRCSDVVISMVDYDFYANRIYDQWHTKIEKIPTENVCKYTEKKFKGIVQNIGSEKFILKGEECLFFFVETDKTCVCFPLFENNVFMGAIVFVRELESAEWEENEYDKLQGIVNIIRTNISKNKLDIASKAKSEFLSRMSHEIRTPMNAILGMCNIALQQGEISPRVQDCLQKIFSSSEYLLKLINDILDMSKIESGKLTLEHSSFQLKGFVKDVETLIRPQIEQKNIKFNVLEVVQDIYVMGDSLRLNQIIINLLSNALKFTPEGGNIDFIAEKVWEETERVGIRFAVKDNGIGISKEQEERVFRAFEQAEEGTTRAYGGTGLGLSICKNLVQMMDGELKLYSELGKGSDFSFVLMFQKALPSMILEEQSTTYQRTSVDFTGKRVLLVEDIELNVEIAKTILELCNFDVEVACDGKVAIDMFSNSKPGYYDVVLMDVRMPVMDGLEATRRIRKMDKEDARSIPIIAMTANAFDEDMKKSIESGMNGHLSKPIDMAKFYEMLNKTLGGKQ